MPSTKADGGIVKKRAGIQSVEIGMKVLSAVAALERPGQLSAIVKGCGLSASQTHRYLASLAESGMVKQDLAGNYDLGPAALRLGLSALSRIDVFTTADTEIGKFCQQSGCTVLIAALGPAGPIVIRWHAGRPPIVTSLAVGSRLSLLRSATGQVFLAFRSNNEVQHLIQQEKAASIAGPAVKVEALRALIRAQGHAAVGGTLIPGLNATAYPIFDQQGQATLVACLLVTSQTPPRVYQEAAAGLRKICEEISDLTSGSSAHGPSATSPKLQTLDLV